MLNWYFYFYWSISAQADSLTQKQKANTFAPSFFHDSAGHVAILSGSSETEEGLVFNSFGCDGNRNASKTR